MRKSYHNIHSVTACMHFRIERSDIIRRSCLKKINKQHYYKCKSILPRKWIYFGEMQPHLLVFHC